MYDLIIIGAGPAGITAAVYAARKMLSALVITKDIGGQAAWSGDIENYTGYQFVSGPQLVAKFEEHLRHYDIRLRENEGVVEVMKEGAVITVKTEQAQYLARTVIIASGKRPRELGVPGESEFKNKGLTFCATCDGPLFRGKDVAVIGGGNSALDAVLQLVNIAGRIFLININAAVFGDEIMLKKVLANPKVTVLNNTQVRAVLGKKFVEAIAISGPQGPAELPLQGVFVEAGLVVNSDFIKDVHKDEHGQIKVNAGNETNLPGVFACGDVTDVLEKQIIIAAGEGAKASLSAFRYLSRNLF